MKKWALIILICSVSGVFAQMEPEPADVPAGNGQTFITLQGIAINSIGESTDKWRSFKDDWESGAGLYIGYGKLYASDWALILQTGYISFNSNPESNLSGDPSYTVIPLAVGGRYYIVRHLFQPYILAMTGINIISEQYTRVDGAIGEATDRTTGKLHFQVGAGVGINVTGKLAFEISLKYNSHVLEAPVPYNMTGLEYGLGVSWFLDP